MIVHIMPRDKFSHDMVLFFEKNYAGLDFHHYLYGNAHKGYKTPDAANLVEMEKETSLHEIIIFLKDILTCDAVILDWCEGRIASLLYLLGRIKRTAILFWGGELMWKQEPRSDSGVISRIVRHCNRKAIHEAGAILTLTPADLQIIDNCYAPTGVCLPATMWTDERGERTDPFCNREHDAVRILVGNSATRSNRHIETFELLAKYADKSIEIILPLSYGDEEYARSVSDYARMLFGEKVIVIEEFLDIDKYTELLSTIDVGIFNTDRQQALGNIRVLLRFGAKVFLSDDSGMIPFFSEEGYCVHSVSEISKLDFKLFVENDIEEIDKNIRVGSKAGLKTKALRQWDDIFALLLDKMRSASV